jgi:hypothetical protein
VRVCVCGCCVFVFVGGCGGGGAGGAGGGDACSGSGSGHGIEPTTTSFLRGLICHSHTHPPPLHVQTYCTDGCGAQRNMTLYAELMKATGKNYSIENCHWGGCSSSDDSSCPTIEWCPFNWYVTPPLLVNSDSVPLCSIMF